MRNAHRQPYLETESAGQKHGAVELEPITYEAAERPPRPVPSYGTSENMQSRKSGRNHSVENV